MKNSECTIVLTTKGGSQQTFRRDTQGWYQISSRGRILRMTPEQVLNHLLPALAYPGRLTVSVIPDPADPVRPAGTTSSILIPE